MGDPLSIGEQISLLLFMMIASKGAAGVTGAGMATLAGGLSSHRPELVDGVGLIVGIDRFMSECRALTNFAGNAVATVLIGTWTGGVDRAQLDRVLAGDDPFDETTMVDDHDSSPESGAGPPPRPTAKAASPGVTRATPGAGPREARPVPGVAATTVCDVQAEDPAKPAAAAADADPADRTLLQKVGHTLLATDRHDGRLLPQAPGDRAGGRGGVLRRPLGAAADLRARSVASATCRSNFSAGQIEDIRQAVIDLFSTFLTDRAVNEVIEPTLNQVLKRRPVRRHLDRLRARRCGPARARSTCSSTPSRSCTGSAGTAGS